MICYHGSSETITRIHAGTGNGLYLAARREDAASYGPTVHTIHLPDAADIADADDVETAVAMVCEDAGFDPATYNTWEILEITEVRDLLAAVGYDGAEVADTTPDGDPHDAVLVWNTRLLSITDVAEHEDEDDGASWVDALLAA